MWSQTIGLRTRPVSDQKKVLVLQAVVLVLVVQFWCCFVKHDLVTLVVIMILKDSNFLSPILYSFSVLCLEHHYCGDQQWRSLTEKLNLQSAFVYFR